jgi:hypothetical protein
MRFETGADVRKEGLRSARAVRAYIEDDNVFFLECERGVSENFLMCITVQDLPQ